MKHAPRQQHPSPFAGHSCPHLFSHSHCRPLARSPRFMPLLV
jgi:hypothetical protein